MTVRRSFLSILASLFILIVPLVAHAETKILTAEANYTMGDGETPSFAEAMALQKAKQMALEQAGTYVESYTKVQNLDLTTEEIQTIAGGVLQVEVLDNSRTLIGDGLRFFVKIKATVTTDKMEELAQRVKGKNVAKEYKTLQEDYAQLVKEIETWKRLADKIPPGPDREAALDQIRKREKAFSEAQQNEARFFQRLVAGEALVKRSLDERTIIDALVRKIVNEGFLIKIGEPTSHMTEGDSEKVKLRVPVTLRTSEEIRLMIKETAQSLGGKTIDLQLVRKFLDEQHKTQGTLIMMGKDAETARYFQMRVGALTFSVNVETENGDRWICNKWATNEDRISPLYLETSPIVPVSGDYQRFTKDLGDVEVIVWGNIGNNIVRWVGEDRILLAGSLNPIHPVLGEVEKSSSGRVVVFDDVRSFTVTTIIPIAQAKQIKAIRGEFVDKVAAPSTPSVKAAAISESSVKGERSWWERLFGIDEEKSELSDRPKVARQPSPPIPKWLSCAIEQ
jgi:hypothetical protein